MDCVFGDISKKASVNQGSQVFSCCFLGVLHFVFRSVMHLEGIFVMGLGFVSRFISGCGSARVALPSVDWTAPVPVCYFCSFVKHQWTLLMGSVSGLFILFCPSAPLFCQCHTWTSLWKVPVRGSFASVSGRTSRLFSLSFGSRSRRRLDLSSRTS